MRNMLDFRDMTAEAERLGKIQEEIDERNQKRAAEGKRPIPDIGESREIESGSRRYRSGFNPVVSFDEAWNRFKSRNRKASKNPAYDFDKWEKIKDGGGSSAKGNDAYAGAVTSNAAKPSGKSVWSSDADGEPFNAPVPTKYDTPAPAKKAEKSTKIAAAQLAEFKRDIYERMGTSFSALEKSISGLSDKVDALAPKDEAEKSGEGGDDEFRELLSKKTPVVFDVGGTQLTFDAICVFHASPCITVVSKIGSAKITPKPGATLLLSYDMDGVRYDRDPVTYLGTRFDLPMFGLSFVGFIRDNEAGMIDAEAGIASQAYPELSSGSPAETSSPVNEQATDSSTTVQHS